MVPICGSSAGEECFRLGAIFAESVFEVSFPRNVAFAIYTEDGEFIRSIPVAIGKHKPGRLTIVAASS